MSEQTEPRLMGMLLRAGDKKAVATVRKAFKDNDGSTRATAEQLGVAESTLHVWVKYPALAGIDRKGREDVRDWVEPEG